MNNPPRYSMDFGTKEKVLNYACQTYQLSRPNRVGAVMAMIRECQPKTLQEWEEWYFAHAHTAGKTTTRITMDSLRQLGQRLHMKITEVVIPEWQAAFRQLTLQDCIDYIYNLIINRTFDGFLREKSVVNDGLAKEFPEIHFEESDTDLDHAGDIDYIGRVGKRAFGIQIKPITAQFSFANYSPSERMKSNFQDFEERYGGKVFVVFGLDGEIGNPEVIDQIRKEIERLSRRT